VDDSTLTQERSESGLLEMVVAGQGVGEAALGHDDEGNAVGQAPGLVGSCP